MRSLRSALRAVASVRPTGRGVALLLVGAVCFLAAPILSLPALQSVTGLLLSLVVLGAAVVAVGRPRLDVTRESEPSDLTAGERGTVNLTVTNRSRLPGASGRWRDGVPRALGRTPRGDLPVLGRRDTREAQAVLRYEVRAARRGEHRLGPLTVDVTDPFGVVRRRTPVGDVDTVVVLPRRTDLGSGSSRDDGVRLARRTRLAVGAGEDDVVARAYRAGDALKRVHWKATAHRGELMVRQEEQQAGAATALVLDADAASHGVGDASDDSDQLEWAVSAAASIAALLDAQGLPVVAGVTGAELARPGHRLGDSRGALEGMLRDLAVVRPGTTGGSPVLPTEEAGGDAVVVLGRPDVARAHAWRDVLGDRRDVRALVARGTSTQARDVLAAAGWHLIEYGSADDLVDRWQRLQGGRVRAAS